MYRRKYQEVRLLGVGNMGSAFEVKRLLDGTQLVAKKVNLAGLSEKDRQEALRESQLHSDLKSPHIVSYKESFVEKDQLIIIMEYCKGGDLACLLKKHTQNNQYLQESKVLNLFFQVCLALDYLHQKGIVHRDIKSSNVYLTQEGVVKLGDFGVSKVLQGSTTATQIGTPYYMSPEVCQNSPYDYKSDVWSLGVLLYEMCSLKFPFVANNLLSLAMKIISDTPDEIPEFYSRELKELVKQLLNKDPQKRLSLTKVFSEVEVFSPKKFRTRRKKPRVSFRSPKSRTKQVRDSCIHLMGDSLFYCVYEFMKNHRQKGTADKKIFEEARSNWGPQASKYCFEVDQLLFLENSVYNIHIN